MSLKQIAQMTGVSVSTVSKVLNDDGSKCASPQLRERIWAAAHELHYVPDVNARNLKKGKRQEETPLRVAVVLARVESLEEDLFFRELYRHLEIAIFREGGLLECTLGGSELCRAEARRAGKPEDTSAAAEVPRSIPSGCGVIVIGRCTDGLLGAIRRQTANLVLLSRNPRDYVVDEIVCDGRKAAEKAVYYLWEKGHRSIGYIGDCSYESRYVGYSETMIRLGLPIDFSHIIPTDQTRPQGQAAMERLLSRGGVSAVLCANDTTALGALDALKQVSKKDRGISVISIDDIEEAQSTEPLLTTIHIPSQDMAHMAVQVLRDRLRGGHREPVRVEFSCRITERESCMPLS